ncbi:hypothetical protein LMJ38_11885 [Streptomyces sp. R1]|uniref:hypothetical protein n=1 Tax=Streptomyces sp. R1 TaxID=1509279 RepID=UPI001E527A9A|nr:hypothetical protein [Streptomyces sp. R1]MCC8336630.1 hypothetical protein [Streptomyces sp. R1]
MPVQKCLCAAYSVTSAVTASCPRAVRISPQGQAYAAVGVVAWRVDQRAPS